MGKDFNAIKNELEAMIPAYVSGDAEFKMYELLDKLQDLYETMEEYKYKYEGLCK